MRNDASAPEHLRGPGHLVRAMSGSSRWVQHMLASTSMGLLVLSKPSICDQGQGCDMPSHVLKSIASAASQHLA